MGVLLSKPNTEKEMETGGNEKLKFAVCSMQGWRTTMEDAHTAELDIDGKKSSFFGVFDGHAGTDVAIYASRHVHSNLRNSELFKSGKYEEALKEAFLKTDADLRTEEGHAECFKIRREVRRPAARPGDRHAWRSDQRFSSTQSNPGFFRRAGNPREVGETSVGGPRCCNGGWTVALV
mmetsp:Transcript_67366/g.179859  ORF Transcript_67366/g.179859 Transcript_67366/m.179859 type:complete len:178 (-) Transcript_67366:1384-1917(-)